MPTPPGHVRRPSAPVRFPVGRAGGRPRAALDINAIVMLTLSVRSLMEVIDALGPPWGHLAEALILGLLALAFSAAAARSCALRFGWLLSAATATGLAIAAAYGFVLTAGAAAVAATGAVVLLGILVIFARA